jgi:SAM-dependent methyltransferase
MLDEHLSQEHDAASRRLAKIETQVDWIHSEILGRQSTRILDLCCGPGLYTSRLAALGHDCIGIDFSPAAIAYAEELNRTEGLSCRYLQEDVRRAEFGCDFELVMMLFGQVNVFRREEARALLGKARQALTNGGILLLEPQTLTAVERMGTAGTSWYSAAEGLFSSRPHLVLEENFWEAALKTATARYFVIDAASGPVTRHVITTQGYANDEYEALLKDAGFADIRYFPSLTGREDSEQKELFVICGKNN